jgi:hypothetical protein
MVNNQDDDLDKILDDLKSQYQTANTAKNPEKSSNNSTSNSQEIDDLLKEIKLERKTNTTPIKAESDRFLPDNTQINHDLDSMKAQYQKEQNWQKTPEELKHNRNQQDILIQEQHKQLQRQINDKSKQIKPDNTQINHDLDSIKTQYQKEQNWQKTQEELKYNRNQQDILIQEQHKQLQRKQSIRQAEKWLADLDPFSDEGMWFNQLAESYPSKLEAAIHYLSTLEQSNF